VESKLSVPKGATQQTEQESRLGDNASWFSNLNWHDEDRYVYFGLET